MKWFVTKKWCSATSLNVITYSFSAVPGWGLHASVLRRGREASACVYACPPVCEHCTCTWVFDGKKPALPGCISISHPTRPPAWPQPCDSASDTNPFQPCLCCVRGEARLDGHVLLSSHHSLVHCTPSKSSLEHNKWQWNMAPNSRSGEAEKRKPKVVFSWG